MQNLNKLAELSAALPDAVKKNAMALIEEMSTTVEGIGDDPVAWKPGFLKLVQGTTDRGSIPRGTAIGDFVLGEERLEKPLKFIPIRIWDSRQYWDPDQTSNKMICWSPDGKLGSMFGECRTCAHKDWVEGEGSACGKSKTALVLDSEMKKVFTVQFSKSNYKVGMELENTLKKAGSFPYTRIYGLNSTTSSTAKNVEMYKIEVLDDKLRKTPEDYLDFLKELFNIVSTDRKTMLDAFYENSKKRAERLALEGNQPAMLESSVAEKPSGDSEVSVAVEPKAKVSNDAKKYTI